MNTASDVKGSGERERLGERFRLFVRTDCDHHTPLYARLGEAIADDADLLDVLAEAKPGQRRPVLLLAAIHALVLASPDEAVAQWYPSVTGRAVPAGDPFPDVRAFALERREELVRLVAERTTQTNEVNRSVALALGARVATTDLVDQPIALVELGASAGLNLAFDRYSIELGVGAHGTAAAAADMGAREPEGQGLVLGETGSTVRLGSELRGPSLPPLEQRLPRVEARVGIDVEPVDLGDPDGVRWLEACLWPDQLHRIERFRGAVALLSDDPPSVVRGDLIEQLPEVVAALPAERHVVVFHSWVLTYVERSRRRDLDAALWELANDRDLSWLSLEAPGVVEAIEPPALPAAAHDEERHASVLGLTRFRDGARSDLALARCHPHLTWLEWTA